MLADVKGEGEAPAGAQAVVDQALDALRSIEAHRSSAPGCGETLRAQAERFAASAVVHEGALYHVVVAAAE
jgi:hypothetical protein